MWGEGITGSVLGPRWCQLSMEARLDEDVECVASIPAALRVKVIIISEFETGSQELSARPSDGVQSTIQQACGVRGGIVYSGDAVPANCTFRNLSEIENDARLSLLAPSSFKPFRNLSADGLGASGYETSGGNAGKWSLFKSEDLELEGVARLSR